MNKVWCPRGSLVDEAQHMKMHVHYRGWCITREAWQVFGPANVAAEIDWMNRRRWSRN